MEAIDSICRDVYILVSGYETTNDTTFDQDGISGALRPDAAADSESAPGRGVVRVPFGRRAGRAAVYDISAFGVFAQGWAGRCQKRRVVELLSSGVLPLQVFRIVARVPCPVLSGRCRFCEG